MSDGNAFDNELNAIMEGNIQAPAPTETGTPATPAPANSGAIEKTYKAAGRDWKADELAKAHDSLVREMGSRNKDWNELKELRQVKENLNKDPEFNRYFRSAIEAYQKSREAGQSQATAQRTSGLPPEVVQKLEKVDRFEQLADKMEYDAEVSQVSKKYKLDDETLRKVEDYSLAHKGMPLEDSYKQMMFDLHQQQLMDRRTQEAAQRKAVSKQNAPSTEPVIPSAKSGALKSDADWRKSAGEALGKFFGNTSE